MEARWREQAQRGAELAARVPGEALPGPELFGKPVAEHGFALAAGWMALEELPALLRQQGRVSRGDAFAMAGRARAGEATWTDVLVASYAWGYARTSLGPARIRRILAAAGARLEPTLAQAAALLATTGPAAAYYLLRNPAGPDGLGKLKGLGPAFFTKFLYFAGDGVSDPPPLILDQVLAAAVRRLCDDDKLLLGWNWRTGEYAFYLGFMRELASRPAEGSWQPPADLTPGALERALFG